MTAYATLVSQAGQEVMVPGLARHVWILLAVLGTLGAIVYLVRVAHDLGRADKQTEMADAIQRAMTRAREEQE